MAFGLIRCMLVFSIIFSLEDGIHAKLFQSQVFDAVAAKVSHENRRFQNLLTQQKNQHLSSLRQWHAVKAFFASDRGSWKEG